MRRLLYCALQLAVGGAVLIWGLSPEMREHGGSNGFAVAIFAVAIAAAATSAAMIAEDLFLGAVRLLRGVRLANQPNQTHQGGRCLPAVVRIGQSNKLTAGLRIGKQPR
jgi:preprotein translocase subunit SecY